MEEAHAYRKQVGHADRGHEYGRNQGHQISQALAFLEQEDGQGPEGEAGQGLVGEAEISPYHVETVGIGDVEPEQQAGAHEKRQGDEQSLEFRLLVYAEGVRNDETRAAEGSVTAGDRSRNHAKNGEYAADQTEPVAGYDVHYLRGAGIGCGTEGFGSSAIEEIRRDGGPDKGYQTFGNHGSVKYRSAQSLILETAGHQRALSGVETAYGSAGHGYEKAREETLRRMAVGKAVPEFRQLGPLDEKADHKSHGHEEQGEGEDRIYASDYLVYRHEGSQNIIEENAYGPDHYNDGTASGHAAEYLRRAIYEDGAYHHHQENHEDQHDGPGSLSKITADDFRQGAAVVAQADHTAEIVVDGSGENAAEHYPDVTGWAEFGSHDRSEDRTRSGYVQELYHEHLPGWHRNVIHSVCLAYGRGDSRRIGAENPVYQFSIKDITEYQHYDAYQK